MKYRFAIVPTADGQKMISLLAGMNYSIFTKFDDELIILQKFSAPSEILLVEKFGNHVPGSSILLWLNLLKSEL